jgi:hypothetical protein
VRVRTLVREPRPGRGALLRGDQRGPHPARLPVPGTYRSITPVLTSFNEAPAPRRQMRKLDQNVLARERGAFSGVGCARGEVGRGDGCGHWTAVADRMSVGFRPNAHRGRVRCNLARAPGGSCRSTGFLWASSRDSALLCVSLCGSRFRVGRSAVCEPLTGFAQRDTVDGADDLEHLVQRFGGIDRDLHGEAFAVGRRPPERS